MPRPEAARYRHSIQRRFSLALALFLVVAMTLLGLAMLANQQQLMQDRLARDTNDLTQALLDKGTASSTFLARIAPQGLLSYDYLLLEGYVEELSADTDIVYAVIFNADGHPVTHYLNDKEPYFAGREVHPDTFDALLAAARQDQTLIFVQRDIEHEGARLGRVEIALSRARITARAAELNAHLQRELRQIALITGGLILVSLLALLLLIEWVFRRMVVKPIRQLSASMAALQAGNLAARADIRRQDQIGYLAERFNRMADDLQSTLAKTEQQAREAQQTRDYLASILDHSADMIATTALDGTVVEFNTAAERILGFARDLVIGRKADAIYCDLDLRDRLYATVHAGQTVRGVETQLQRGDGSRVDVELTMSPLRDAHGALIGAVCIGRDITQARALRRDLIQAEKLASIGQVAGWIAHQIRNLLGRLMMNAAALKPDAPPAGRTTAHHDLNQAIAEIDELVTDLLDYSKTLSLHTTPIDLNAALYDMLRSLQTGSAPIRIERDFAPDLPVVSVDVFKMEQAIGNLLKNAVQAMPRGGLLRLRSFAGPGAGEVSIIIEDSGAGIPVASLEKVFQPFYTTKPGGTGLGLALAQRIIEAHGGRITAANAPGGGAVFEIALPY